MRKLILLVAIATCLTVKSNAQVKMSKTGDLEVSCLDVLGRTKVGGNLNMIYTSRTGQFGEAKNFEFNKFEFADFIGFIVEQGNSESSGIYLDGNYAVIWSPGDGGDNVSSAGYLLKVIDEDGMNLKWYVNGNGADYQVSDTRHKKNVEALTGSLDKIEKIEGVQYNFIQNKNESQKDNSEKEQRNHLGFLAQDLEKTFPEVVESDESGFKYINYEGMVPILVEAIKELDSQVESLKNETDAILSNNDETINNGSTSNHTNSLRQNKPNLFTQSTQIKYFLTENAQTANIYICNMNGKQIKSIELQQKGAGNISIHEGELKPGIYLYTLVVDGQVIDTKQMILTE